MSDNNSFIIDNPEQEPKRDKEIIEFEMNEQQPSPVTAARSTQESVEGEFNLNEGS